jgi:inorganic triphosphatase YgiF
MSREIELKYRFKESASETINIFLGLEKLDNLFLGDIQKKEIVDVYYDTFDFKISKAKSILRVRVENFTDFYITIKTSINVNNAIFEREELEDIPSEQYIEVVHNKLKSFGLDLKDFDKFDYYNYGIWGMFKIWELKEIFVCENTRNIRNLFENDCLVAELSVDDVLISTFGKKEKFQEIEIEAKNNNNDKLFKLAEFIDNNYSDKLEKGLQSKYETGIKLLFGKNIFE